MLTKHDLIPLELATRAVHRRVYPVQEGRADPGGASEDLNAIAHAIAGQLELYTYEDVGDSVRRLRADELAGGQFHDGGREIRFADGRPGLERLAVASSGLDRVCEVLARQKGD